MKKLLLASTALVGFAGAAAAEVSLSGYAEIGIAGGENTETQFHSDFDVKFSLSGASDNGLEFGATIDLDEVGDDCGSTTVTTTGGSTASVCTGGDPIAANGRGSGTEEHSVWVSGSFGKVTLGDTDGALDWAAEELASGSSLADDHTSQAGYYSFTGLDGIHDGQVMRYEYSFGDWAAAISAELDDSGVDSATLGLGVKWSGDFGGTAVAVGLGYQDGELGGVGYDQTALSVSAKMSNGVAVHLGYATGDFSTTFSGDWVGVGIGYSTGALSMQVLYGDWNDDAGVADADGFGLSVNYDLGGGAVAMLGYGDGGDVGSPYAGAGSHWSAGLGLSF